MKIFKYKAQVYKSTQLKQLQYKIYNRKLPKTEIFLIKQLLNCKIDLNLKEELKVEVEVASHRK